MPTCHKVSAVKDENDCAWTTKNDDDANNNAEIIKYVASVHRKFVACIMDTDL